MSETVVNETTEAFLLEGEAPRLGSSSEPMLPNVPPAAAFSNVDSGPTLPVVSQVLTDGSAPALPTLPAPTLPAPVASSIADVVAAVVAEEADKVDVRQHPMAHLMPEKIRPSEASLRAAEVRNAKKKKARKIKIVAGVVTLAVIAVVGPPATKWLIDAVNEAGSVEQEDPADIPTEQTGPDAEADPQATPSAGLEAIDELEQLVGATSPPAAP